jgi:hypothetical protein
MAAFWAVFTFGGSGLALTAHGSLDLKQEIQIQIQVQTLRHELVTTFFYMYFVNNFVGKKKITLLYVVDIL